ncbi:hypothetical protein [Melittangium boletus]|uniref:JAB domain-containing protein n=1 Tax=Melittangium boletus DSM 14713 TaxID=1294270 RepID=A0A250IMW5_9BACT|nr:hypothetical protein [Melittangium boletus]ATB32593.1 hypothetical protein MEBOL_006081 [Melittangium boletus DSM 14713]
MKGSLPILLLGVGCATPPETNTLARGMVVAKGPWSQVPAVEMPAGDASIPITLLRDAADALLMLPGAKVCDPAENRPLVGLSTEYCSTVYVAGGRESLSWRVTEPSQGNHSSCKPFFKVKDDDYPDSQVWVVGYIHNHPCASTPSSLDLGAWPTDSLDPYVSMAEVRLIPGNPSPAIYKSTSIEMASALVAERQDGTRIFLRYFPTGEIQQWSDGRDHWVTLGTCVPREPDNHSRGRVPQCSHGPLRLLRE